MTLENQNAAGLCYLYAYPDMTQPWTTWWETDLPCQFSKERAQENCDYLLGKLSPGILKGIGNPGTQNHPLFECWRSNGAISFLEMNALAEDLRCIDAVPGIDEIIRDLLASELCKPTWHVIHSAAMFARGNGNRIVQFFPQTSEKFPDFLLEAKGLPIAVEAKLMTKSEKEADFEKWAKDLVKLIFQNALPLERFQPILTVVIKSAEAWPQADGIIKAVQEGVARFSDEALVFRSSLFNLFIDPASAPPAGLTCYRYCSVLCARSLKEDIRVQDRSKRASKQISAVAKGEFPGVLCLGITRVQQPQHVYQLLRNRFSIGQYSSISSAMLLETGTHVAPPKRSMVDVLSFVKNEKAQRAIPTDLKFGCLGMLGHLDANRPITNEIAAYRYMTGEGKVSGEGEPQLFLPDLRVLTPEMMQ
jgi:hypothetical protein